jgi:uncharacterized protein (TIGR00369 family)
MQQPTGNSPNEKISAEDIAATRQRWLDEERQVKNAMGRPGTATPDVIGRYSGLEFLQAMARGELDYPPIADTLNFTLVHFEPGRVIFQGTPLFEHYNPIGSVHGGWFCTLLDSALACAVQTKLPKGRGYTTLELKVNMIRPLTKDSGPVRAEGSIVHVGRQSGIAEARLYDSAGKIYASASTTCLIFEIAN